MLKQVTKRERNFAPIQIPAQPHAAPPPMIWWPYQDALEAVQTAGSGHVHWTVQAFGQVNTDGSMTDVVTVSVEAPDEESAIARAAQLIKRPGYRIAGVQEVCSKDEALR